MQTIFWISFGLLWVIVVIQGFALLEVLRQIGLIHKQRNTEQQQSNLFVRNPALTGQPLPKVSGYRAIDLHPADWDDFLRKDQGVLILLSTTCIACRTVAEKLHKFVEEAKDVFSVVVLVEGNFEDAQIFVANTGVDPHLVIIDERGTTAQAIGVDWKPGVVFVQNRQVDQVGIINDVDQLDLLLEEAKRAEQEKQVAN